MSARPEQLSGVRRLSTGVLFLCLLSSVMVVLAGSPSAAAETRGPGYRIPATGKASGGWIGARRLGGANVFRIEPSASARTTNYRSAVVVANLNGGSQPSLSRTQRAAYIVSVYGTRDDNIQAAAVDAAVLHLLAGGKWRIDRKKGSRRLRAAANTRYVRSYASTMLARSKQQAGPVTHSVRASQTTAGSASKVVATVRHARTGRGLGGLPVTFRYAGVAPVTSYTNASGQAVAYITPNAPNRTVTATVGLVPEWRLHVRSSVKPRSSDVAVAGAKMSLSARATVVASGAQVVAVANSANVISTGQSLAGTFSVSGGEGTRTIGRTARGPFSTSTTSCTGPVSYSAPGSISTSGSFTLPVFRPSRSGYYRWAVTVGGNAFSLPSTGCGAPVRVRKQATISQFRLAGDTNDVRLDEKFRVGARVAGFDRGEAHTLTSRLYGPFANKDNAACSASRLVSSKTVTKSVSTNGDVTMPPAVIGAQANVGWYVWQTSLNTGDLIIGDTSTCGVPFNVTP